MGYGREYRYAHDEPNAHAAYESHMPDGLDEPDFYQPVPRGLEIKIGEKLEWLKSLDEEVLKANEAMLSEAEQYGKANTPKGVSAFFQVLSCLLIKPIKTTWYSGLSLNQYGVASP